MAGSTIGLMVHPDADPQVTRLRPLSVVASQARDSRDSPSGTTSPTTRPQLLSLARQAPVDGAVGARPEGTVT